MKERLEEINRRIAAAAEKAGRNPESVRLVAVSKTKPVEDIINAMDAGAKIFGENYIQEAAAKIETLSSRKASWHFIGHLQSNKAKIAVNCFDLIHTVDSFKLAGEIDKQAKKIGKIQNILVQVNTGMEESKSGVAPENARELAEKISGLPNVRIKGLMTIPPFLDDPEEVRPYFKALKKIRDEINKADIGNVEMNELSMGMTGDFEVAIEEGATLVRIGTAIFGKRN